MNSFANQVQQYFISTSYQKEDTLNAFRKQEERYRPNTKLWYSISPIPLHQQRYTSELSQRTAEGFPISICLTFILEMVTDFARNLLMQGYKP